MKAKKRNWKIYGLIMVLLLELFILPVPEAKADLYYTLENGGNLTLVNSAADRKYGYEMAFTDVSLYGVKPKIISSKKSVAKIKNNGGGLFTVIPKKAGTTKIKLTATVNRKKITRKATIKIVKFKQPFKTLKINGKNYTKKIKQSNNMTTIKTDKSKVKLNYKLKSDWKVLYSSFYNQGDYSVNTPKVKNGSTFSLDVNDTLIISMTLRNKKTHGEIMVSFNVSR